MNKRHPVISYLFITLGILIYTFGWAAFMLPAKIVGGGVSGISSVLNIAVGIPLPIGVLNFIINGILLAVGFKVLGPKFGVGTIFGIVMSSLSFILWQQVLHVENLFDVSQFGDFMCAIIGGVLCGGGIGLTFMMGGNSGGTDIIALIINKYHDVSPGKVILYLDIFIIGSSWFVSHRLENVIFGYIVMVTMTYVLDLVLDGNKQSYQIMVFSQKNDEIAEAVTNEVGRGATLLDAEGSYTKQHQKVLLLLVHRTDKPHVMQIIHRIDSDAFISVSKAQGVYGKNFEKLKL